MVPIKLSFDDFSTFEGYVTLQNTFLTKEAGYKFHDELFDPKTGLTIKRPLLGDVAYMLDESTDLVEITFENDFLLKEIPKMSEIYFDSLKVEANKANRFTPEELKYYFAPILEHLNHYLKCFEKATFLPIEVRESLVRMTLDLIQNCEAYYSNPYPGIISKLQLIRCNRDDVIFFFHCLKRNDLISGISDADLGRIIDNICEYKDEATGKFKGINASSSRLYDYNSKEGGRNANPSAERLKKIFNQDFFNL